MTRKLLMIPGPIEFAPEVMEKMGQPTISLLAPAFIESFGRCLEMMREIWQCPSGQPFIVAGSGTFAMDMAGSNLTEAGDHVLVVSTGYFGERYADLLKRYGAKVTLLKAEIGDVVPLEKVEAELAKGIYKLMTFTHVDTSTGVLLEPKPMADLALKYKVLSILDGVCSVAGQEIRQEEWGIDVVITASQKAVGVPPGLALLMASPKAITAWKNRHTQVANYYADWENWLPVMQTHEARGISYFATPPVNLVQALETSFELILKEGLEVRFARHERLARKFREEMSGSGLLSVTRSAKVLANTLSTYYFPEGVVGPEFLKRVADNGVVIAGGLLPEIKTKYFRIGHMGIVNEEQIERTVDAIKRSLAVVS